MDCHWGDGLVIAQLELEFIRRRCLREGRKIRYYIELPQNGNTGIGHRLSPMRGSKYAHQCCGMIIRGRTAVLLHICVEVMQIAVIF